MTVSSHTQARLERAQDHAEWLETHNRAMAEIREIQRRTDERIEKLAAAIGQPIADTGIPPTPPL